MAEQPNLFPRDPRQPAQASPRLHSSAHGEVSTRAPLWMTRVEFGVRLVVRLYLGGLIFMLPWLGFWTQNNLFTYSPTLMALAGNGFVRGLVSGLGLLNIVLVLLELRAVRSSI